MASILALAGGAAINALAFSGTNYLFSAFSDHGLAERKRHNLALEKLTKAREKYNEERLNHLDFINQRIREKQQGREYIQDLDAAMSEYARVFGRRLAPLPKEPELSNYYQPSEQQKNAELVFVTIGMTALGGILLYNKWKS